MSCGKDCGEFYRPSTRIYYFSGTGNSKFVADSLSEKLKSEKRFIPSIKAEEENYDEGNIGFVFPVYSWGVPPLVLEFINALPDYFWERLKLNQGYVWAVMTCGDEVALAPEMLKKSLKKRGIEIGGIWSVIMPNNYVILPGFDVDPKKLEWEKLDSCKGRISEIAEGILQNMATIDVTRGSIPRLKTKIVYPLFKKWGINTAKWHYTISCVSCGKCAMVCPMHNIKMEYETEEKKNLKDETNPKTNKNLELKSEKGRKFPNWGNNCVSCLACYHICPHHAVAYGKETKKKGQYFFPKKLFKKEESC